MKAALFRVVRKQNRSKKLKVNSKILIFSFCLFISTFIWYLISLSNISVSPFSISIKYINTSNTYFLANKNDLPKELDITVEGLGYDLLQLIYLRKNKEIEVDVRNVPMRQEDGKTISYYKPQNYIDWYSEELLESADSVNIIKILPDSIYLEFDKKITKTIEVRLVKDLSFKDQYTISDSIYIFPRKVKVNGPQNLIDTMKFLYTTPVVLSGLNETIRKKVSINIDEELTGIKISENEVNITIPVAKFTEDELELPIEVINKNDNFNVRLLPSSMKIKFHVSSENYDLLKKDLFKLVVDYNDMKSDVSSIVKVHVAEKPSFVKAVTIIPDDEIEYIRFK